MNRPLAIKLCGLGAIVLAVGCHYPNGALVTVFVGYSAVLVALTVIFTLYVHHLWNAPKAAAPTYYPPDLLLNVTNLPQFNLPRPVRIAAQQPILFGRTVDGLLLQVLDYTFRDFVTPWLSEITHHSRLHADIWREDIWMAVQRLKERAKRVDAARMLAVDMTVRATVHLEKIRIAQARAPDTNSPAVISTAGYLATGATELEFLRKLCEIAAIYLLPRGYSLNPLRLLLTEVVALKVLQPLVDLVTSPDFLNQKIVHHIEQRLAAAALHKRSYEYAASFEDFLRIIGGTNTIDELLLMRTSCVNDIVQATAQQQLHAARKVSTSTAPPPPLPPPSTFGGDAALGAGHQPAGGCNGANGGDAHDATDECGPAQRKRDAKLRRYVQQLTYAKAQCEKNLARLGWTGAYAHDPPMSVADILATVCGRRQFGLFLEPLQASGLIGFHSAVEELRLAARGQYHQLGSEIYYAYIRAPAPAHVTVERAVRQRMESFLLGDQGPEVFYEMQRTVFGWLEDKYHAPFVLSDEYAELKRLLATEEAKQRLVLDGSTEAVAVAVEMVSDECTTATATAAAVQSPTAAADENGATADVIHHSTYARTKLDQLQERLDNKTHALAALRASLKPESKLLAVLGQEVDWLRMERRQLEAHLRRTELWAEHLGAWRACVQSVEVPDEKEPPQFMIVVQVDERVAELNGSRANGGGGISTGWVVLRSLVEFHELHKRLRPLCADLKALELPSTAFKLFVPKNDRASLERAKGQIQRYLNFILAEDDLYPSEAIYAFLSPSSENLKQQASVPPKKQRFSLLTLFKPNGDLTAQQQLAQQQQQRVNDPFWGPCGPRDGEADISTLLDGASTHTATAADADAKSGGTSAAGVAGGGGGGADLDAAGRDSIAEPLYALMGEIFDMGGVFKWLRRSLISFVQITYGRTINRQIRDSVHGAFDEPHLHFYVSAALKSLWPGGVLAVAGAARSTDMQQMTATAAQSLLLDNMPEVMCNLVGAQTARLGTMKVWRAVQNAAWNKQMFYELLEILMVELFPEIRQLTEPARTTTATAAPTTTTTAPKN